MSRRGSTYVVSALVLLLAACGTQKATPGAPPTGEQGTSTTLRQACPQVAKAVLATSPTAPDQLQALAATLEAISADGNPKVRSALRAVPADVRRLADDPGSARAATTYAADVAGVATACARNGSPFPVS